MKTLTHATAFMFAVISSISITSAITSIGSVASAAETNSAVCQQTLQPATSGGAVRDKLAATAGCNSEGQRSTYTGSSVEQPKSASPDMSTTNVNRVSPNPNNPYLKTCPSGLRAGTSGGAAREYLDAMQRC